jgi:hypothetical protein
MTPDNASQRILHPFLNGPFSSRRNTVRYNTREKYQETPHLVPITTLTPQEPTSVTSCVLAQTRGFTKKFSVASCAILVVYSTLYCALLRLIFTSTLSFYGSSNCRHLALDLRKI